jgi:hypothetical protein
MPDINSLQPSPSPTLGLLASPQSRSMADSSSQDPASTSASPPQSYSPSVTATHSLAAAAALNAGLHSADSRRSSNGSLRSPRSGRRRSSIRMSLNINDPTIPGPGELQMSPGASRNRAPAWPDSPSHQRAPSLGELHQELESEQEMQVVSEIETTAILCSSNPRAQNRLLSMIRQQQQQILTLQTHNTHSSSSAVAIDDSTPTSERSMSYNQGAPPPQPNTSSTGSTVPRSRSPFVSHSLSRHSSYRSSRDASPSLRPISGYGGLNMDTPELLLGQSASRDESAFYQAETQTLTRENQMLKMRIRELG